MEQGINSLEMIEAGLRRARASESDFLPSVGKFASWCREEMAVSCGLPESRKAFSDLNRIMTPRNANRDWSVAHPAVYWAFLRLDWYLVSSRPEKDQYAAFEEVWREAKKMALSGFKFPDPPAMIEHKRPAREKKDVAMQKINRLKGIFDE